MKKTLEKLFALPKLGKEYNSPTDEYGGVTLRITPNGCFIITPKECSSSRTNFIEMEILYENKRYIILKKPFYSSLREHQWIAYILLDKKGIILGIIYIHFQEYNSEYEEIVDRNFKKTVFILNGLIYPDEMMRVVNTLKSRISKEANLPISYGWGIAASMKSWDKS